MLTEQRHQFIVHLLKERGFVKLQDVMDLTNASESTIRRDFVQLEKEKLLKRVHGGASILHGMKEEIEFSEKQQANISSKVEIAKYAASLIEDGDCIYLDAGTTVYEMISFITAKDVTVVTNGLTHIDELVKKNWNVYLLGGSVKVNTRALIGRSAIDSLKTYRFNKCFLGANGVDAAFGYTTTDPEEASVKKLAADLSLHTFVLVDETKVNEVTFSRFLDIEEATMITNANESIIDSFRKNTEVKVVTT